MSTEQLFTGLDPNALKLMAGLRKSLASTPDAGAIVGKMLDQAAAEVREAASDGGPSFQGFIALAAALDAARAVVERICTLGQVSVVPGNK